MVDLLVRLSHHSNAIENNKVSLSETVAIFLHHTVYLEMKQWIDNVNYRIETAHTGKQIIELVCESHIQFERIHPFGDGNGRTGRLLMNYLLMKNELVPLVIEKRDKESYIFFLANEDIEGFSNYAEKKIDKEQKRMDSFSNKNGRALLDD